MQSNFEYLGNLVRGNFRTNREKDAATKKQRVEKSEKSQFLSLSKKSCINIEERKKILLKMENTFDHYRSTLKTMLKNRLERCSSRERSTFSNGKYFKGRGGKSKKRIEQRNRARFPTLRAEEREGGRATLEKIKGTREREREKALGPEHYSRTRIWITRGWSETCQEARKRRRRWWWGRGFQSFFQA